MLMALMNGLPIDAKLEWQCIKRSGSRSGEWQW